MSSTRPSGIPIISGDQVPVSQEVSVIDERGRLNFLPRWLQGLDWHPKHASSEVDAMMVLSEPGLGGLYLWEVYGPKILECYEELAQSPKSPIYVAIFPDHLECSRKSAETHGCWLALVLDGLP